MGVQYTDHQSIMYKPGLSILPPKPNRKRRSRDDVCLDHRATQDSHKCPRGNKNLLKASSMVMWGSNAGHQQTSVGDWDTDRILLNTSLDTSQIHCRRQNTEQHKHSNCGLVVRDRQATKVLEKQRQESRIMSETEDFSFKRQLSLPNYSSSVSQGKPELSLTPNKTTEQVCRLESPRSRKATLQRRWDSTTALDKRCLVTESLGRCLFYGSENDLLKSTGVLYANQDKVYVHEETGETEELPEEIPEEISLDKLMSEQLSLSELETINENPEIHDLDLSSPLNLSQQSSSTEVWSHDLDLTVRSADFAEEYHHSQHTWRSHPLTSSTRSKSSCHSLDGLLDRLKGHSNRGGRGGRGAGGGGLEPPGWLEVRGQEEETESRMRGDSELWIRDFLNELSDPHESPEPEFYNLDDFRPTPLPQQKEPKIYSNGFHKQLEERTFNLCNSTNGREFVRAQTVPSIPIESYLTRSEIKEEYFSGDVPPPVPPRGKCRNRQEGQLWERDVDIGRSTFSTHEDPVSGDIKGYHRNKHHRKKGSAWTLNDSDVMMPSPESPTLPTKKSLQGSPQLYYVTPPQSQMAGPVLADGSLHRSTRGGSITRLARRLSQREQKEGVVAESLEHRKHTLRQRSVSLDCGDKRTPLLDADTQHRNHSQNHLSIPSSPSVPTRLSHRQSDRRASSPNLLRKVSGGSKNQKNAQVYDKKKRTQDLQALFSAVENQDLEAMKMILETCVVDVNGTSADQLTPLDIAVFMNNLPMARMLLSFGARENPLFLKSIDSRAKKLDNLVKEAESKVSRLKNLCGQILATSTQQKDVEKQLHFWEYRLKLNKRMQAGYEYAKRPEPPTGVTLTVTSSTSLCVSFQEPVHHNGAVVTMYRVSWSTDPDFRSAVREQILENPQVLQYEVQDLIQGSACYCRCQAWNVKGWSDWTESSGPAIPSSWRELDEITQRSEGRLQLLNDLFTNMKNSRPANAAHVKDQSDLSQMPSRKSNVRKSIKSLFSTAPKFQKTLQRGVYLASVVCCEDRVLVTNDDLLPVIEVDENYTSASLNANFHWLMKIACTWEDVKTLRQDMEKNPSQSSFLFRSRLLQAANQLQSCLGLQDLGLLYHQPIRDHHGSVIFVAVRSVKTVKVTSTAHLRWVSQSRLLKRAAGSTSPTAMETLLMTTQDMLAYENTSTQTLPPGLYLGYLKLSSSVDMIRIMADEKLPNVLPHCKIRDTSHVTREEWQWLRSLSLSEIQNEATAKQVEFQQQLHKACQKLLSAIGISEDEAVSHRLYDLEVVELSENVNFIVVLPPSDSVCNVPGNQDMLTHKPGYVTLPVKLFEMVHMCTYQYEFISRYCRLSSILEMDFNLAQQAQREAFSSEELSEAKCRVGQLTEFQQQLDESWKGMRWIMDIITYARDKTVRGGLPLGVLYAPPPSPDVSPSMDRKSDVSSSLCSDPGYHSDWSSIEQNLEQVGHHNNNESNNSSLSGIVNTTSNTNTNKQQSSQTKKVRSSSPVPFTTRSSRSSSSRSKKASSASSSPSSCSASAAATAVDKSSSSDTNTNTSMCSCEQGEDVWTPQVSVAPPPSSGTLRIYTAYNTGLSRGTSVKLHVTCRTSSREVINLVVQQLNRAVLAKGRPGPVYGDENLEDFCLVAVVGGSRERVLRDDFQPLLLQNPWTKGRLFIRLRSNVLAALEQGQVTSV